MVNKKWTPVDSFVTEYGFRYGKTFVYQPGSGEATMETGNWFDLDDLRALIKSIEHHELQINVDGTIFVYSPEEHGERPEAPELEPDEQETLDQAKKAMDDLLTKSRLHEEEPDQDEIAEAIDPEEEKPPEEIEVLIPE